MFTYEDLGLGTFPAAVNMTLEEHMLERAKENAVMRFFDFPRDSVVLGYAQGPHPLKRPAKQFDLVRRVTGGSHVQVGPNTLAYSFAVPRDGSFENFEDMRAYYAERVADALRNTGIGAVDVDNEESTIKANGKVIASHAVTWGVESALLHGLLLIDPYDVDTLAQRLLLNERKIGRNTYSEYDVLKNLPAVSQLVTDFAQNASPQQRRGALKKLVADAIRKEVDGTRDRRAINPDTIRTAHHLQQGKHFSHPWIQKRDPHFTEEEIEAIPYHPLDGPLEELPDYCLFQQVNDKDFKRMARPD